MDRFAQAVMRRWWIWLIAWPVATILIWTLTPRISDLISDSSQGFVPSDMPSQRALELLRSEFPDHSPASRAVILAFRKEGLSQQDFSWIARVTEVLSEQADVMGWKIHSVATTPYVRTLLISPRLTAAIIAVDLPAEMLTQSTVNRVRDMQRTIARTEPPAGLVVDVTGNAALGEFLDANTKRHIRQTKLWALVAVVIVLLLIYRSPAAMFLPLATVGVALLSGLGWIGWAASHGLPVNGLIEAFIAVIVGGSGVDYCLLLFARYREELVGPTRHEEAVQKALARSSGAIIAGAVANAAGLATMILARNRDLYTSGPILAFAICMLTLVVLTFTPALMRIAGRRLARSKGWGPSGDAPSSGWRKVASMASQRPGWILAGSMALLTPFCIVSFCVEPMYDAIEEYPPDASYVRGAKTYYREFHNVDAVAELAILIRSPFDLRSDDHRESIDRFLAETPKALSAFFPIVYVRSMQDPTGTGRNESSDHLIGRAGDAITQRIAGRYYLGRSGQTMRVDAGLQTEPRALSSLTAISSITAALQDVALRAGLAAETEVILAGETALYADFRNLRKRDFLVVSLAATAVVLVVVWILTRSAMQSLFLVLAMLAVYLCAYGLTWCIFRSWFGISGLNWRVDLLLFVIMMSLGQDYNIFVVSRIQENAKTMDFPDAVTQAVACTGRVVSSCGLIMAVSFASMLAGSVLVMKQMATALAVGILIDTYLIRPLAIPAALVLWHRLSGAARPK